ncbi:hypothetical protein [Kaistia soli]|nr:hypothetical protein [Kaistia soli]
MLLALGWENERIANALSITPPTLKKHYFREMKFRDEMRDRLESRYAMIVWMGVEERSGAAFKEFRRIIDHSAAENADGRVRGRGAPKAPKPPKLGKKEERKLAAESVGGKFSPPAPPKLIVDNNR